MKKTNSKRFLSLVLSLLILLGLFPASITSASAAAWSSDYRIWSQGYAWHVTRIELNEKPDYLHYGCWVLAQAKMIYESGINRNSSFNPDVYYQWQINNALTRSSHDGWQVDGGNAPVLYARSIGKNNLSYLGKKTQYVEDKIWDNINRGYYSILHVIGSVGDHYVMVANDLSKSNKTIWIYDSWSNANTVQPRKNTYTIKDVYTYSCDLTSPQEDKDTPIIERNIPIGPSVVPNGKYAAGTYQCDASVGVRIRSGASTKHAILGLVPYGAVISVTSVNNSWGYCSYNGISGWTCLDYYDKYSEPVPATPSITGITADNIARGKSVTLSWGSVSYATSYTVKITGAENREVNVGNTTSYTCTLGNAGTYSFAVRADGAAGSSGFSGTRSCISHNQKTVRFVDHDGSSLGTFSVDYGASVQPPVSPYRKGYTFRGWSDSYSNVTSDRTITAQYTINTYTVRFFDKNGNQLGSDQKVTYGSDAVPPDPDVPTGYEFIGWSSEEYKNVYTENADKVIKINGIYKWENDDLPIVCNVTSAKRQQDGYYVYFNLTNYPNSITRGRAVVSLKTAEGKLVDMTESAAFSIPKDSTKTGVEVFIPCDYSATKAEVQIVDSYSSGVPISRNVTSPITNAQLWSDWSTVQPAAGVNYETRTEYRYRDKEWSTGNTGSKTGWNYSYRTESVGGWSGWTWTPVSAYELESYKREVQTRSAVQSSNYKTQYLYSRWRQYSNGTGWTGPCKGTWSGRACNYYFETGWLDSPYPVYDTQYSNQMGGYFNMYNRSGDTWYNEQTRQVWVSDNYATQYSYRDIYYTYHFFRWKDWSAWSPSSVSATSDRQVESRTVYRTQTGGAEDSSGTVRNTQGVLDPSLAGKQISLFVYKVDEASDYSNEYVGQSVIGADGSYSFTYKLREEPSVKTGDMTVAIGIEGTTNTIVVDTIEAPKPTYTVTFYNWDGSVYGSVQNVTEGEDAVVPENPTRTGYDFIGWDKSVTNIRSDTEVYAEFELKKFVVVFIDWENRCFSTQEYSYGAVLTPPEMEDVEGYDFLGWDRIREGNAVVTDNMVVTSEYEKEEYNVRFYGYDGEILDTQVVQYGDSADYPDLPENDDVAFATWFNPEDYQYVDSDADIYPDFTYKETASVPAADHENGEYDEPFELKLTSADDSAVIYYYFNGDMTTERIYTGPFTVDRTCSVTYYAEAFGKNRSSDDTRYYCVNDSDYTSDWMLQSELPDDVTADDGTYFTVESADGYKYKDTLTAETNAAKAAAAADGWTLENTSYSDYSEWSDTEPVNDADYIEIDIKTREAEDVTKTWYKYSHYKYVDAGGEVQYAPAQVEGFNCTYEELTSETRLSVAGFLDDDMTSYYLKDDIRWFNQTPVNGKKTQYRFRHLVENYYRWTGWTTSAPAAGEVRDVETDTVYRYSNNIFHIVTLFDEDNYHIGEIFAKDGQPLDLAGLSQQDGSILNLYGYGYRTAYTDAGLTQEFDPDQAVTSSLELYLRYDPVRYTVRFEMQDGTLLDSQSVEYMQAAEAPATDAVPGYVFGGWDKDFDSITEDTVITGKYFREDKYATVTLDKFTASMYAGSVIKITATTANTIDGDTVEWLSDQPNVAAVDENGNVRAVSAGTATITARIPRTNVKASCTVYVSDDETNSILLSAGSSAVFTSDRAYIVGVKERTAASAVSGYFVNEGLRYFSPDDNELDGGAFIGTGSKVKLFAGSSVVSEKTFVILGDINGDGKINNKDVVAINKKMSNTSEPSQLQLMAMDANADGKVNLRDAALFARYIIGLETL